ncbi:MAG: asparagine synthase (glutamine-hydrolyzing) [Bacteroidales bacterium]|nr:asparagine synthase (glutamine-hydrolyzing) [Bacteroidales bacterium]
MCGITGFLDFNRYSTESILQAMTDILYHRGPDDSGYYFDKNEIVFTGLGHRRLSILDLSPHGHQPMRFQHLVITYNGEVYNFKEIRVELEQYNYRFDSYTDTEVILKAYHRWGTAMVHRFNGMFAFAIYDMNTQKLLLFRDRAGIKPLYWYFKDNLFVFASELKSFHQHPCFQKELNNDGLALFLQYGYIPQPHTIFKYCYKLKGGHYLTIDLRNKNITDTKYWDVIDCYQKPKLEISECEAIEETERLLKSSFEYRMVSDVPVGMFLSGGYDSSVVTAILQANRTERLKTFTIGFHEKKYNEAYHAKKIAEYLGTEHTEYYCSPQEALDILPRLPEIWDEPFGDPSAIPTILVSRLARKQVTVSLSADGGDEAFGGYDKYISIYRKKRILEKLPKCTYDLFRTLLKSPITHLMAGTLGMFNATDRLKRWSSMIGYDECGILTIDASKFTTSELQHIMRVVYKTVPVDFNDRPGVSWLDNLLAIDYKTYQIDDILTKVDRATMSVSLEGREPLLDYRIIEYIARLDQTLKIRNGEKKYLLKKLAYKYIPQALLERPKMGFGVPISEWFKDELRNYLLYYLDKDRLKKENIFNEDSVVALRNHYLDGKRISVIGLWYILIFQMWKEKWYA